MNTINTIEEIKEYYIDNRKLYSVTLELINNCNANCIHCYLDKNTISIQKNKVFELLDNLRDLGVFEIKLTGGEIMMREDINEIIKYARKRQFRLILLSNLTHLNEKTIGVISKYYVDQVETTIFSLNEDTNDGFMRNPGGLKNTLSNINLLLNMNIEVLVKTWIMKFNFHEMEYMKSYFENIGCRFQAHTQIYPDVNGKMKLESKMKLSNDMICSAQHFSDNTQNREFPLSYNDNDLQCKEFSNSLYISANGDVFPCVKFRTKIGNIYNSSISDIWTKSKDLRKIQNIKIQDSKECINCKIKKYCVRCGAMSYIYGGDFLDNNEKTCEIAKIRRKIYENL